MPSKIAGFNSSRKVKAALQASLFNARENRLEKLAGELAAAAKTIQSLAPFDWIDATDSLQKTLSGTNITEIGNKGSSSDALTHISNTFMVDSTEGATCGGSQNNYQLGDSGDRNFLHNGTGCEWFFINEADSTAGGNGFVFYSNISGSSNPGGYVRLDTDEDLHWVTRGASTTYDASMAATSGGIGSVGAIPVNVTSILHGYNKDVASPATEFSLSVNGAEVYGFNSYGLAYNSGDHSDPVRLCVSTKGTFKGWLCFDHKLTDSDRAVLLKALRIYYGMLRTIDTYIMLGDSLMNGGALNTAGLDSSYESVKPRSVVWGYRQGLTNTQLGLHPMSPRNSQVEISSSPGFWGFGPDLTMAHKLEADNPTKHFAFLKQAVAGDIASTKWLPEGDSNNSWDKLLEKKTAFESYLKSIGLTPNYKAAVVSLGTNDQDTETRSGQYSAAIVTLNTNLRGLFSSNLPIYLLRTAVEDTDSRNDGKYAFEGVVQTAQDALAGSDSNLSIVNPVTVATSLSWREETPNGIHYDMDAAEEIGIELGSLQ